MPAAAAESPLRSLAYAGPVVIILLMLPYVVTPYQTILMSYGLIMAIAALGFNLLLGYTGLLSFGHSAYFGLGAYAVAFMVKYLHVTSMELFVLGALSLGSVGLAAVLLRSLKAPEASLARS